MNKKLFKLHLFLFCIAMVCAFGAKSVVCAEIETTVQTETYAEIVNVESGSMLNVYANSSAQQTPITIWQQDGTVGQFWKFCNGASGYYLVPSCAESAGRALNVYGDRSQIGSSICLWDITGNSTQAWIVEAQSDGSFILRSKDNPDCCLGESGVTNGSAITLKAYSLTDNSIRWKSSLVTGSQKTTPVPAEKQKKIKLSATSINTYINIPIQLTLENADASKVTWSTSKESKGIVNKDGVVRAVKKNCSFTVYAKYEGKTYKCKVSSKKNNPKFSTYQDTIYYAVKNKVPVYLDPHSSAPVVKRINKNTVVSVCGELRNKSGNLWYLTSEGYYIYSGNCVSAPKFSTIEKTILMAQRRDTVVYSAPDTTSSEVIKLAINTPLTMIGELTGKDGAKWYVTYGPDNTGAFRYVRAEDFAGTTYLSGVPGCWTHAGNCTFCATTTMIRRRAVLDGVCDFANAGNAVTYEMIDCYAGGLIYAYRYWINGGKNTYSTNWLSYPSWAPCTQETLAELCKAHPEGIVIYDSEYGYNGNIHAVCLSDCIQWEDGSYSFYVYDINDTTNWGTSVIRLEDSSLFTSHGYDMNTFLQSIRIIVYTE